MTLKRPQGPAGTIVTLEHTSRVLADNPLGDPNVRKLSVWLPPQYDQGRRHGGKRFPVLFDLVGFTGSGAAHLNWKPFEENVAEQAARLVFERKMGPVVIVFPDCFTRLGGNQYVNSSAIGRYADYLTRELVPFVDREFRTLASREYRGCFGKSSGGYGAIRVPWTCVDLSAAQPRASTTGACAGFWRRSTSAASRRRPRSIAS